MSSLENIYLLLKSMEKQLIQIENRLITVENKLDRLQKPNIGSNPNFPPFNPHKPFEPNIPPFNKFT